MTPASSKPATSSCSGNGSTRWPRSSCCASRPRSRTNRSEPSPNASLPVPDVDLHLPDSAPHCVAVAGIGPREGGADAPIISRAKRIAQRGRTLPKSAPPGRCREGSHCASAATSVAESSLDRATLAGGSKKPISACSWGSIARGVVGEEHACRCRTGTGTRCLARLRLEDHDVGARGPPTAGRLGPPHPQKLGGQHGRTGALHATARTHRPYRSTLGPLAADQGNRDPRQAQQWPPHPRRRPRQRPLRQRAVQNRRAAR